MLEKTVETYLVDRVRAAGGDAYKFTSPQRRSVPDRIVAFPPGRLYFVELKRPGNKPTKPQLREHERLRALGCDVRVIDSREAVDTFVREASAPPAPYLYVYEYPSPFGGTHREFAPTTWNGQRPARTVALYTTPQQPATVRADALTDIDSWAEGAKFALRTIAKHDICFLTDSMKMTAVKLATEACIAEKERLLNEYPDLQPAAAPIHPEPRTAGEAVYRFGDDGVRRVQPDEDNPMIALAMVGPCPFCGSENVDPKGWLANDGRSGPACDECGATAESVEGWNRRAGGAA
ncbi:hypothetical protein [Burkholderia vietnamiensis]|uniref:hypothetical protein n=1 Tax=Burkholderia vietnamiensis TaxID=60552 RepID=UPI001ABAAAB1|nr:hypothetical protein [Burkholderia vietnamiensis]